MLFCDKIFAYTLRSTLIRRKSMMASNLMKIQIKQGIVVGQEHKLLNGNKYNSFKGIPYAKPPLGKLRFQSPSPLEQFDVNELECFEHREKSLQQDPVTMEIIGSEDCLFLNIYAPLITSDKELLPVMVWIHGGGYHTGGCSDSRLPLVLVEQHVIVVTLNYRLGVLGFLCYPEEGIWGNAGLKDQRLALEWVQENIMNFNGDPNNVTLFGESAGATSVHSHLYAKHAHKLFHKAIMQSGTANMEWAFQINPKYKTLRLADTLGCKSRNTNEIIEFMQTVSSYDIIENTMKVLSAEDVCLRFPFKPVVEAEFSPDIFIDRQIERSLQKNNIINMPIIMGYNSAEGIVILPKALDEITQIDNDLSRYIPRNLLIESAQEKEELVDKIRQFYFDGHRISANLSNELVDLLSDYHFNFSLLKTSESFSRLQSCSTQYFYCFEYSGQNNLYKRLFQMEHLNGACHADELCYLFQTKATTNYGDTATDAAVTRQICSYWANFARCGRPIDTCSSNPVVWNAVKRPDNDSEPFTLDYLAINAVSEMRKNPDRDRFAFWNNVYNQYKSTDFSNRSLDPIEN